MSDKEEAYVNLRLKIAEGLKVRRQSRGITQMAFARTIRSSQSRVAKIEAGDPTVSLDLLVKSLFALGAFESRIGGNHRAALTKFRT